MEINGYQLSRAWFDFCFDNPELINPNHTAIFMFSIEHCNRLGWKDKFGFPSQMTMDALGIKNHHTYIKYFNDLVEWGFFKLIQKSTNQYSANVISLGFGKSKNSKALDKAFIKHTTKQHHSNPQSTQQSNDSIDKPITNNQLNNKPITNITNEPLRALSGIFLLEDVQKAWLEWEQYRKEKKQKLTASTAKKQMSFLGGRAGPEAIAIINQSILNGWTGLFELKTKVNGQSTASNPATSHVAGLMEGFKRRHGKPAEGGQT
jgi:hypothetical protein